MRGTPARPPGHLADEPIADHVALLARETDEVTAHWICGYCGELGKDGAECCDGVLGERTLDGRGKFNGTGPFYRFRPSPPDIIGANVRRLARERGLSATFLASRCIFEELEDDVATAWLDTLGRTSISADVADGLASLLGTTTADLCEQRDEPT